MAENIDQMSFPIKTPIVEKQGKKFQYGQGKPDELDRKNTDANYGIPRALSTNEEIEAFEKRQKRKPKFNSDEDIPF